MLCVCCMFNGKARLFGVRGGVIKGIFLSEGHCSVLEGSENPEM